VWIMALVVRELGLCAYHQVLALQESLVQRKLEGDRDDYLLVLEHLPVYTLGRGADDRDLQGADRQLGVDAVRVGRGGGVTFHGPGQLVSYPIVDLEPLGRDVSAYVRKLEGVLIRLCRRFGVVAGRQIGSPGVWVGARKIASVGIGIRRWVAFHGVALNVTTDLDFFAQIVTCRTPGVQMTSLARELGEAPSAAAVRAGYEDCFREEFAYATRDHRGDHP
jgi:lipoate-protein ligase B